MCKMFKSIVWLIIITLVLVNSVKVRHQSIGKQQQGLKLTKSNDYYHGIRSTTGNVGGLWPSVFNLATKALISVNATCGEGGREEFCRMSEVLSKGRCGYCDNFSHDLGKRHPIHYAIDGTNKWWQSPAIFYGIEYEYITITIDLKQIYQVAYVIIKAANSPRPGTWILEKSLNGKLFLPWQYFATSDKECMERFGVPSKKGKHYNTDTEVICTHLYSRLTPMENGEIHTSLIKGRPGANETSPELLEFTKARYVRIRLQGLRGNVDPLPKWLSQDVSRDKKLFYSIRDINIGGQCVCNGHAATCRHNVASGHPECDCEHQTCGPNCERCCPMYNQKKWSPATSRNARLCTLCNCNGHATSCHYDETVEEAGLSLDVNGNYIGGGVCNNCTDHTTGINCEKCIDGYFRPKGVRPDVDYPCVRCECDSIGSFGKCDEEGKCTCKTGYDGSRCDVCASGYKGYPRCEICPCDNKGVVSVNDCDDGNCICKINVEGQFCERCKSGHFALDSNNPYGCLSCYCSGVTTLCESAILIPETIDNLDGWLISDMKISQTVKPSWDEERQMLAIGNYEIAGIESYYWLSPKVYTGNKLDMYSSELIFKVHWVVMRGDTSGKPTTGPNVILIGANGMRIASGDDTFSGNDMTFRVLLAEDKWYHVPEDVKDIITRSTRNEYKGEMVTRYQFLSILTNIKFVLLRAKFHTDQIEGLLERVTLERRSLLNNLYNSVEKCSCPSGYTGLSCETCDYGYVRIITNTSTSSSSITTTAALASASFYNKETSFCVKCDCNGHSSTCNPDTGQCFCDHNTIGENCERCLPGYYGNPLLGTRNDCKPCACPLLDEENNFSPSCQLDTFNLNRDDEHGYVCTQCPKGYTGDHCEICDDGFYGIPTQRGSFCQLCDCGGGPCDRITGQCLGCRGNTEGWRCERCKTQYFGDPQNSNCEACLCDSIGSSYQECNNITGQCTCKERFTGRTCDKCQDGYGNVTALCTPCSCNPVGSKSDVCDPHSGLCDCQPGVEGFHCDACQHLHYGFSSDGCSSCNCNANGSEILTCDITTGQCRCKPHYVGRTCDNCEDGYWNSAYGCIKCDCDIDGSITNNCNNESGRCYCKDGVGGDRCDDCLRGYYGFSSNGCKVCEPCNKQGHVCNPITGKCECPPYSLGDSCQHCTANTWGYEPYKGCKVCNCSTFGSVKQQCELNTGICMCLQGYADSKCDRCDHGYYGYPKCKRCNCNLAGVDRIRGRCNKNGLCQCDHNGNCLCKANVEGRKCDTCLDGTFGLLEENPEGCTTCFCFGRSTKCTEAGLTWGQIRMNSNRVLTAIFNSNTNVNPITSNNVKRIEEIPDTYGNVTMELYHLGAPLYWKLNPSFNGDRILSYGGYLRFTTITINPIPSSSFSLSNKYPSVVLKGNNLELHYYNLVQNLNDRHEVRLHESLWKNAANSIYGIVTRKLLMIVLQNVEDIYVKASDYGRFDQLILSDVTLDTGIEIPGNPPPKATGVEICKCPTQYNSSSCQNPSIGFYRHYVPRPTVNGTIIIDAFVGTAKKCHCNGRSNVCDIENGRCLNCTNDTDGDFCEKCAEGYYGNPMVIKGKCEPCPCPSTTQNFAKSCKPSVIRNNKQFQCKCKDGYHGSKCDVCTKGYYGQPKKHGGRCVPCDCNKDGRISIECDSITGQCQCKPGITGKQCSQCIKSRYILQNNTCIPCDNCTQWLLNDVQSMSNLLHKNTLHLQNGNIQPPWDLLNNIERKYIKINDDLNDFRGTLKEGRRIIKEYNLNEYYDQVNDIKTNFKRSKSELNEKFNTTNELSNRLEKLLDDINVINVKLIDLTTKFDNFGKANISTIDAVKNGLKLLNEIKKFQNLIRTNDLNEILSKCNVINERTNVFNRKRIDYRSIKNRLILFHTKLMELIDLTKQIDRNATLANVKSDVNNMLIRKIIDEIKRIEDKYKELNRDMNDVSNTFEMNAKYLNDIEDIHDRYEEMVIDDLLEEVRDKQDDFDDNLSALEELTSKAREHSNRLKKKVQDYISLFNLTDKEIKTINATESYTDIIRLINESRTIVDNARNDLNLLLKVPEGSDNVSVQVNILYGSSTRLLSRINNLLNLLTGLEKTNRQIEKEITDELDVHWNNGLENRKQSKRIQEMKDQLNINYIDQVENDIEKFKKISNEMKDVYKTAIDINRLKEIDLDKKLKKIVNMSSNVEQYQEHINYAKQTLSKIYNKNFTFQNVSDGQFAFRNNEIMEKLAKLKAEIAMSKHLVDEIRVSLSGNNCSRRYIIKNLEPSLITKFVISINYKRQQSENRQESSLIYLGNSSQFIHLKIEENVTFLMKLKDDLHQLKYKITNGEFYTFRIERIAGTLQLFINNDLKQSLSITNDKNVIFEVNEYNYLHIGHTPGKKNAGIPGCIKDVIFNDYKIGLWNFYDTQGNCGGCTRPPDTITNNCKRFNGNGYSYLLEKHQKDYNPTEISLQFSIRTFDEDALIFLAVHLQDRTFMSVTLKDGRIQYEVHYKNEDPLALTTKLKYNSGRKVRVSIAKKYYNKADIANMRVEMNGSERENLEKTKADVQRNELLKIKKCKFYFGGVTPHYTANYLHVTKSLHTHRSLLGEIDEVMGHQAIALMDNGDESKGFYGIIETKCNEFSFRKASFNGKGYVQMKTKNLKKNFRISFVMHTKLNDSLLMVMKETGATTLRIQDGRIVLRLPDKQIITSETIISYDFYHIVEIVKEGKTWTLKIDGKMQDNVNSNDEMRSVKMFIGGYPNDDNLKRFSGEIKDIFVNNDLVTFNEASIESFENVKIGRSEFGGQFKIRERTDETTSKNVNLDSMQMKEMPEREDCGKHVNVLEENAAKFGDTVNSYVVYILQDMFWKKDYVLEFDFRTFHNDGILLFSKGVKGHYNLLEIINGKIALAISGKRTKKLQIDRLINDGTWHNILIEQVTNKRKRKLSIVIDKNPVTRKLIKIPQNKLGREMYVGGLPDFIKGPSANYFKGCIRSFKINNVMQGLVNDKNVKHYNIGQCFPNIERGAYFRGDSYAIQSKYFRVTGTLELNFEFRTIERNGILLSVSNPGNAPAFSIELQNGAVVMSIDMGNGIISNVTNYIQDFSLCNKWHKIIAIISTELTVNVDGVSKSWVLSDTVNDIEASLYIGGIPDYAPSGTLKVKENFNGCLRNFKIDDQSIDWNNMEKLNNVAIDSCPVGKN